MYKLFMAFRYLRAHKIIYFSITGVALGIMVLVVVTSIMGGFSRDMRARIRGMQSDIVVTSWDHNLWIEDYDALCAALDGLPHVEGCSPRIEYGAWMGRKGIRRDVRIVGIVPETERKVSDIEAYFRKGTKDRFDFNDAFGNEPSRPGVVVGGELGGQRSAGLMTARDAVTPILCIRDFETVGEFNSGMAEYDSTYIFMHLSAAQEFLKTPGTVNSLAVKLDDYQARAGEVRAGIIRTLHARAPCDDPSLHRFGDCGKFRTMTWEQSRRILLQAVEVEKGIQIIILFLIVLVAGFNIIAIYTLVVRSKTRDIGILRALGATEGGVLSIFLTSGGLCGLFGSIFGIGLGLLLSYNINAIAEFIRIASREMNRIPRADTAWAAAALGASGVVLIWNWLVFYKERRPHPWIRIVSAAVAFGAAAWLSASWGPGYKPYDRYDPEIGSHFRGGLVAWTVGVWALLAGAWRFLDRWRRRPGWIFFGSCGTIVLSSFLLAIVASLAIAASVLLTDPDPGWAGLELFPRHIYYLDQIPVFVDYATLAFIVAMTLLVSLIFSVYPAMRAAAANPIEAIRDE